jgi:fatty-acyl-CoA synthase
MLRAVSSHPTFAATDISSLAGINSGSSVVPADVMAPFFDRGVPVGQVYGTTETGPTAVVLGYDEAAAHIGSCGREAAHTELRIVDGDGADVAAGAAGELWLRGPHLFSGYWNAPEATAAAFAAGGWFRTGDIGYRDAEGYVFIADRIKDVVITGGENVYPAEIEPVLAEHPAIAEVAVIARPDGRWGEIPVAVIVPTPGSRLSIDELRGWCDGRLARFKQPRAIAVVDELPRTALGKVKKHELRHRLGL